jgi:hypothetical protein
MTILDVVGTAQLRKEGKDLGPTRLKRQRKGLVRLKKQGKVSVICSDGRVIIIPEKNYFRHLERLRRDTRYRADEWAMFEEACRDAEYLRQLYGENGHIDGYI